MNPRVIVAVVIAVLAVIYVSYYYTYPREMAILQTTLGEFSLDLLREKQPLVIQDRISDIDQLRTLWFRYNPCQRFQFPATAEAPAWRRNRYKYLLIQAQTGPVTVYLAPQRAKMAGGAPDPDSTVLAGIRLEPLQSVLVPYKAYYALESPDHAVPCLGFHDLLTYVLP